MANEILVTASLAFDSSETSEVVALQATDLAVTITAKNFQKTTITVGLTERSIPLGGVTTPRWAAFKNVGTTGNIGIRVASGGAYFATLNLGEIALLPLGAGAVAPWAIADAAGSRLEYLLCDT